MRSAALARAALLLLGLVVMGAPLAAGDIPVLNESAKLLAPDGGDGDGFGISSAVDGNTAVFGAYYAENEQGVPTGAAYVFEPDPAGPDVWGAVAKLLPPYGESADQFGISVALEGDTLVVGADEDWAPVQESGSAFVFEREAHGSGAWELVTQLVAADQGTHEKFGYSVALSGDTILVGAYRDKEFVLGGGAAYVFERNAGGPGSWGQVAKLVSTDLGAFDEFGFAVAVSGDTAVVGELWDSEAGSNAGAAHIFERDAGGQDAWGHVAKLTVDGEGRSFGSHAAIDGNTVMVGEGGFYDPGAVYVFERDEGGPDAWGEAGRLLAPNGEVDDSFGATISIEGDRAVIGAREDDDRGSAFLFVRDETEPDGWGLVAKLQASDRWESPPNALFARSGGLSGDTAVFGSPNDDDLGEFSGSAYTFSLEGCVLKLRLDPLAVQAGEELRVGLHLEHNRPKTVTVPFQLWIENAAGDVLASKTTPPLTFHHGDTLRQELKLRIPDGTPPGRYAVKVGIDRMQQGIAVAQLSFRVVGPSALRPSR